MNALVEYTLSGKTAQIRMDDGKVNIMTFQMLEALHAAFDRAERERVVGAAW